MMYYGQENQPANQNDINSVGMNWMPDNEEYVIGNVAFVKKKNTVTQQDIDTIYKKQQTNDPYDGMQKPNGNMPMICCTVL